MGRKKKKKKKNQKSFPKLKMSFFAEKAINQNKR